MRRALWLLPLLVTQFAQAAPAPLALSEQAKKAQVIVRAIIGQGKPQAEGDVTYTVYPLDIKETVAGDPASLPQYEGKPALYVLQGLEAAPKLSAGQEALLLLYLGKLDSPLVGVNQGFYPVQGEKVSAGSITELTKLREAILAARGSK